MHKKPCCAEGSDGMFKRSEFEDSTFEKPVVVSSGCSASITTGGCGGVGKGYFLGRPLLSILFLSFGFASLNPFLGLMILDFSVVFGGGGVPIVLFVNLFNLLVVLSCGSPSGTGPSFSISFLEIFLSLLGSLSLFLLLGVCCVGEFKVEFFGGRPLFLFGGAGG